MEPFRQLVVDGAFNAVDLFQAVFDVCAGILVVEELFLVAVEVVATAGAEEKRIL